MDSLFSGKGDDTAFHAVRDDSRFSDIKQLCMERWAFFSAHSLAEPAFNKKLSDDFHAMFWEMELAFRLHSLGKHVSRAGTKKSGGPDFKTQCSLQDLVYVEATSVKRGGPKNGIPRFIPQSEDPDREEPLYPPDKQTILRITQAVNEKANGKQSKDFKDGPYVIAINLPFLEVWLCRLPSLAAQALLGAGPVSVDIHTGKQTVTPRSNIVKQNGASISTCLFGQSHMKHISGVLLASSNPFTIPMGTELEFLHNPMAKYPVKIGWLRSGVEYWIEGKNFHWRSHDSHECD